MIKYDIQKVMDAISCSEVYVLGEYAEDKVYTYIMCKPMKGMEDCKPTIRIRGIQEEGYLLDVKNINIMEDGKRKSLVNSQNIYERILGALDVLPVDVDMD